MTAELMRAWTTARCLSRETPPPVVDGDVVTVEIGGGLRRVLLTPTPSAVAAAVAASVPGDEVKFAGVSPMTFPAGWKIDVEQWLMTTSEPPSSLQGVPDDYHVLTSADGGRITVDILHPASDAVAAHGQAGIADGVYVPDMITTAAAHRRRGLGTIVMAALAHLAADQSARHGILIASPDGRALYRSLGWTEIGPVTEATDHAA